MNQAIPSSKVRVGPLALVLMINALQAAPHTYVELADACGLHHTTLRRWLGQFRKPTRGCPRLVHIAVWEEDRHGRRNTPAFAWGSAPDAKRQPATNSERQRAVRQRRQRAAQVSFMHALAGVVA